jgi:hypothetical protein
VRLAEAPSHGLPIIAYDANCTAAATGSSPRICQAPQGRRSPREDALAAAEKDEAAPEGAPS